MSKVKIEGIMNTTALPRGEVIEVERTERVERLIANGYVREVPADGGNAEPLKPVEAVDVISDAAPPRNALTAEWLTFVRRLGIEEPEDASRDKLIADYDEYLAALGGSE